MASSTVLVRVKRKLEDDPLESLVLSTTKKAKPSLSHEGEGSHRVFKLLETVPATEGMTAEEILAFASNKAPEADLQRAQLEVKSQDARKRRADVDTEELERKVARYQVVPNKREGFIDLLDEAEAKERRARGKDPYAKSQIMCNMIPMVRSSLQVKQEKARADEFVYDVYVEDKEKQVHSLKDIEDYNLHVECFEEDLLFGGNEYSSDEDECDDDEDSNAEDHYRNDYPEEEFSDDEYGGEEEFQDIDSDDDVDLYDTTYRYRPR